MTNKTYNKLLKELYQLNLKLTEEQLILDKIAGGFIINSSKYGLQYELVGKINHQIKETLAQIKEMELEIEQ